MIDAPNLPESETVFWLTTNGLVDTEKEAISEKEALSEKADPGVEE
jgi:hypothetical protein